MRNNHHHHGHRHHQIAVKTMKTQEQAEVALDALCAAVGVSTDAA